MLAWLLLWLTPESTPWWLTLGLVAALASFGVGCLLCAAVNDARSGRVPNWMVALAAAAGGLACPWLVSAAAHTPSLSALELLMLLLSPELGLALLALLIIWGSNEIFYRVTGRDGLGFGDIKWSLAALLLLPPLLVALAWPLGAMLALLWLGWRRLRGQPARQVYFVPWLVAGLVMAWPLQEAWPHLHF